MVILVLITFLVCVAMPAGMAIRLWRKRDASRGGWALLAAETLLLTVVILIFGRWDIAGMWTRYAVAVLALAAVAVSWRRHAGLPWREAGLARRHWQTLLGIALAGGALVYLMIGMLARDTPVKLAFPIEGGRFTVAQGGGVLLLNAHRSNRAQAQAADITAVGPAGFRARGLLPTDLSRYVIYGATVTSPCAGRVEAVADGFPDLIPPAADRDSPAGNSITIACAGVRVEIAHLQPGSLRVAAGDSVATGQPIGLVGNSGNTSEPHLHIHAVDPATGRAVQMAFDGRIPVRNRMFVR